MQYEEVNWYSERIKRYMRVKVYGHYGVPILVFPSFNKNSDEFYLNGTLDALNELIDSGKIKLFCIDSNDNETVASNNEDKGYRAYMLKMYHEYVINEVLPFIYSRQGGYCTPIVMGVSMGATHASISFFNHPDLYGGILGLSGGYDMSTFFFDYMDEDLYYCSPVHFLGGMSADNSLIDIYNSKRMILTCGKGSYEHLVIDSNCALKNSFERLNINVWFDILGEDAIHDWSTWNNLMKKYLQYFIY